MVTIHDETWRNFAVQKLSKVNGLARNTSDARTSDLDTSTDLSYMVDSVEINREYIYLHPCN